MKIVFEMIFYCEKLWAMGSKCCLWNWNDFLERFRISFFFYFSIKNNKKWFSFIALTLRKNFKLFLFFIKFLRCFFFFFAKSQSNVICNRWTVYFGIGRHKFAQNKLIWEQCSKKKKERTEDHHFDFVSLVFHQSVFIYWFDIKSYFDIIISRRFIAQIERRRWERKKSQKSKIPKTLCDDPNRIKTEKISTEKRVKKENKRKRAIEERKNICAYVTHYRQRSHSLAQMESHDENVCQNQYYSINLR